MKGGLARKSHSIRRSLFAAKSLQGTVHRTRWVPAANVTETPESYTIKLAVPGLSRDCFEIHYKQHTLVVSGHKDVLTGCFSKQQCEYNYENWSRTFNLPADADAALAGARYVNGELIIGIPRNEKIINGGESDVFIY